MVDRILADPADEAARLVYADELVAGGDPRGEFIEVQCALARGEGDRRRLRVREAQLLDEHEARFQPAIAPGRLEDRIFRRGFVEHGRVSFSDTAIAELFELTPLRSLHIASEEPRAPYDLLASARFQQLDALHLDYLDVPGLGAFLGQVPRLRSLELEAVSILGPLAEPTNIEHLILDRQAGGQLLREPAFAKVRSLDVDWVHVTIDLIDAIATRAQPLDELRLRASIPMNPDSFDRFVRWPGLASLSSLDLDGNRLGPEGARQLPTLPHLRSLALYKCEIGVDGLAALPELPSLVELNIDSNGLDDAAIPILLGRFPALKALNLTRSRVTTGGIRALLAGMRDLERLRISYSEVDDDGARVIAEADSLANLVELELFANKLTSDGFAALAASPNVAGLEKLVLRYNFEVDQRGIDALAASPHLELVCHLEVFTQPASPHFSTAPLEARFGRRLVTKA